MGTETELKLGLADGDVARLLDNPSVSIPGEDTPVTRHLSSVYFDTADLSLRERGVALRVRRDGDRRVQTIKGEVNAAVGAQARGEWEADIGRDEPDLSRVEEPRLRALLGADGLAGRLRPLFSTEIDRTALRLQLDGGATAVELALDVGEIRDGAAGGRLGVREAELELKAGRPAALYELALRLHRDVPFTIETETKAERGYALAANQPPRPRKAGRVVITPATSAADAFRAVARDGLAQILGCQACALRGEDPEGVHQMRVGLRRLRAALGGFRGYLPEDRRRAFNGELRWLARKLGRVRDLDVFATETLPERLAPHLDGAEVERLGLRVAAARAAAQAELRRVLRSPRYTELVLKLLAWVEGDLGPAVTGDAAARRADEAARRILRRRDKGVRGLGRRGLDRLDAADRHELRKRVKELRYAAEFFEDLYPGKPHRRYLKALRRLQDGLGALNDAAVARRILAELGADHDAAAVAEAGPDAAELRKLWAAFADRKPLHNARRLGSTP